MAGRTPTARYRGIFYNWGTKKKTQAAGQARMQIYKDGLQIMSFDDDGTDTSGDSNGPQTKMNQQATTTGDVTGMNVSPRIASGYNGGSITALKLEPYLKGTNSMSGDYRALEIGMDDTGTNTVTGDAVAIRVFSQMRVNPTADFAVMEVEAQGDIGAVEKPLAFFLRYCRWACIFMASFWRNGLHHDGHGRQSPGSRASPGTPPPAGWRGLPKQHGSSMTS